MLLHYILAYCVINAQTEVVIEEYIFLLVDLIISFDLRPAVAHKVTM